MGFLGGFAPYGTAFENRLPPSVEARKLHAVVYLGLDNKPVYEFLVDISGKKRWVRSAEGSMFDNYCANKRFHRFNGVKPATAGDLEVLNTPFIFANIMDDESRKAFKKLELQGGFGEVTF
jgi:hypothetical protein